MYETGQKIPLCQNASFDIHGSILAIGCPSQREVHVYHWNHTRWVPTPCIQRPTQLEFGRQVKLVPRNDRIIIFITGYHNVYQFRWRPDHRWNFHSVYYHNLRDFGRLLSLTPKSPYEILVSSESHVHLLEYPKLSTNKPKLKKKFLVEYPEPIHDMKSTHVYANDTLFFLNNGIITGNQTIGIQTNFASNQLMFCYIVEEEKSNEEDKVICWFNNTLVTDTSLHVFQDHNKIHAKSLFLEEDDNDESMSLFIGYPDYFNKSTDISLPRGKIVQWDLINDSIIEEFTPTVNDNVWYFGSDFIHSRFEIASVVDGDYLFVQKHQEIIDTRQIPLIENTFHAMDTHFVGNHSSTLHNDSFVDDNQTIWTSENISKVFDYPRHFHNLDENNTTTTNNTNADSSSRQYWPLSFQFGLMILFLALPLIITGFTYGCCTGKRPKRKRS